MINKQNWVVYLFLLIILIVTPMTVFRYFAFGSANYSPTVPGILPTEQIEVPINSPTQLYFESSAQVIVKTVSPTQLILEPIAQNSENSATPTQTIQNPPPTAWKDWPVLPNTVSEELKQLYKQGITNGNDPHAFSIFGDCQSLPDVFLGIYDHPLDVDISITPTIYETVANFQGSFDRYSPTVKDGTTEGALLYPLWNDNKEGYCNKNESPIDCELRVHNPSIVFIRVGTHYESRNEDYLIRIIDNLLERKIVPVIVTKADNRELDERINQTLVRLAARYDLPVWNFWASVQLLDNQGVNVGSVENLTEEAYELQVIDGIRVLDFVWHQLNQ